MNISGVAYGILCFANRASKYFENISTLTISHCFLVAAHFEYRSAVWSLYHRYLCIEVESVRRKFLRIADRNMGCPASIYHHGYTTVLSRLKLCLLNVAILCLTHCSPIMSLNGDVTCLESVSSFGLIASWPPLGHHHLLDTPGAI